MFPSENSPSRESTQPGDETSLGIPSRDGLVSLSQASEVLGFRGQELWKMLRGAGITIHRVEWDECRGSAITLRDLFRLRQAQRPRMPAARQPVRPPAHVTDLPQALPAPEEPGPLGPIHEHPVHDQAARARKPGTGDEASVEPLDVSEFGADMDRLRDLVSDAQVRNEYLSVELQQLRGQMSSQAAPESDVNLAAIAAVRDQAAATMADLRDQVRSSAEALDEAAEALEVERERGRQSEQTVKGLRAELVELSDSPALKEAREALLEAQGKAARVQADLERALSLQERSVERLEREKSDLGERLTARAREDEQRHAKTLEESREALREERLKAERAREEMERSLALKARSLSRMERENESLEEQLVERAQDEERRHAATLEDSREALSEQQQKAARVREDLEHSLTLQGRSLARFEREKDELVEQLAVREREFAEQLAELERGEELRHSKTLEEAHEELCGEQEKAIQVQGDLERSLTLQARSMARLEREKEALVERLELRERDEVEHGNQALAEAGEALREEQEKAARILADQQRTLDLHKRSVARLEREKVALAEQIAAQERDEIERREAEVVNLEAALEAERDQTEQVREELERSRTLHGRALERMEREKQALADRLGAQDREEVQKDTAALEDAREALLAEQDRAARVQHDLERTLTFQRRALERMEREKEVVAERIAVRDEVERNNQRYIDRLEREAEDLRRRRGD